MSTAPSSTVDSSGPKPSIYSYILMGYRPHTTQAMQLPINFRLLAERAENRELRQRRIDRGVLTPVFGSIKLSPRRGFLARVWAAR